METDSIKWVGSPCGLHGAYIFYKAFKFSLEGRPRILSLGDFFFVRCKPGAPICIAELQLLWEERNNKQLLSSSKLYFLPEDTPEGRSIGHGEDEVVAVSEKVIVKLDDLMKWTCSDFSTWTRGLGAVSLKPSKRKELRINGQKETLHHYRQCTLNSGLSFKDVLKEKADLGAEDDDDEDGDDADNTKIIVLSYPQYCRYRTMLKRIQNQSSSWLVDQFVMALGGIAILNGSTRILYCRDTFDHPALIESESVCDELALNLKGRPRKKKVCSQKRDAQVPNGLRDSNEDSDGKSNPKSKCELKTMMAKPKNNNNGKNIAADEKSKVAAGSESRGEEQAFLVALYKYMKERNTPIERIPYLGFKQINLWTMFQAAQNLGGYEVITARRQWKQIYDELGGNPGSTSAATCTRRHYERLILPYERYIKGEEDKPLPPVKPRKQENSSQETESKMKAAGTKRRSEQIRKGRKEKDTAQRMKENCEATSVPEGMQEMDVSRETLVSVPEGAAAISEPEVEEQHSRDLAEGSDARTGQPKDDDDKAGGEHPDRKHGGITPDSGKEAVTTVETPEEGQMGMDTSTPGQNPEPPPCPPDLPAIDSQEETAAGAVPAEGDAVQSDQADQSRKEETEGRPGSSPQPGAQRQHTRQPERGNPHKEKEEVLASTKSDACPSYMPVVYSRGHPGIMSPLAKKKLLSQVSGTLPNNYSIGAPPLLLSSKKVGDNGEETVKTECSFSQGSSSDPPAVNRPSVIQRAHSIPKRSSDELGEAFKQDGLNKLSDSETAYLPNHHLNCSDSFKGGTHYPFTSDLTDNENNNSEKKCCPPSQVSSFLVDFYSSPHLHNLYKHTEHHLNDQTSKYHNIAKNKSSSFMQRKNQDAEYLNYLSNLHQPEKKFGVKSPAEEQPTDLSLPKLKKMLPRNLTGTPLPSSLPLDAKSTTAGTQPAHSNYNPKACRVPPMPMVASAKTGEAITSSPAKMEEAVRPIMCSKASSQVIGTTKPIKRNRESTDCGSGESPEKKHRAVSPISKDPTMKEKTFDLDGEGSKTLPPGIFLEGHKFPLPTPIFPGVYPGAFVSQVQDMCDGLSSHFPVDYAHPLQYLKNQAVLSPLMQPLAIHSFMIPAMQRQILASTGASPQLYRHLSAAASPVAATYGDILHHSLYPLGSLNPQVAYSSSPISSLHPSTKL
ncbi:AT-rich interactive domain-containing protein 5B isoform X1 [Hypanus sabinus]|uniref:AT-rich interactive domain-containing protein 5B isoform X1 n=3 Tax=Hypanus sabinus TaxID=79690 RepID=UPI0028C40724|nr:AT-rich interactive domain-containing protein 5B isoform X1 [Hypanus sabinus]